MTTGRINRWDSLLAWLAQSPENKWSVVKANSQRLSMLEHPEKERSPVWHAMVWAGVLIRSGHAEFDPQTKTVSACSPYVFGFGATILASCLVRLLGSKSALDATRTWSQTRGTPSCSWTVMPVDWRRQGRDARSCPRAGRLVNRPSDEKFLLKRLPTLSVLISGLLPSVVSPEGYWEQFGYFNDRRWGWKNGAKAHFRNRDFTDVREGNQHKCLLRATIASLQ